MRALQITKPHHAAVIDVPRPEPAAGEALIRVHACGICGTDVHILRGEYMGDYPVIPGHEFAGEVVAVGAGVTRFRPGDRVAVEPNIPCDNCYNCLHNRHNFCLNWQAVGVTRPGGMAGYVLAPEKALFAIGALSYEQGAFVEPLACVLHGVERAGVRLADRVTILGAGPIGLLLLQVVQLQGAAEVVVLERRAARAALAQEFGAHRILPSLKELVADGSDMVIDATGVPALMERTTEWVRKGGTILLFGVPPRGARLNMDAFAIFEKGLTLRASFTSLRNSYQAVKLLQTGQVRVDALISHRLPLEEFEHGVELIETGAEEVKKVLLIPFTDEGEK